jgi:ATP-grasp domain, R2K clade family 2
VPTLVVDSMEQRDARALADAAQLAGWTILSITQGGAIRRNSPRDLALHGPPAAIIEFANALQIALLEPPLDWLAGLPARFLGRQIRRGTVGQARSIQEPVFIKTLDPARKWFDAGVFPGGWALPCRRGFPESTAVLVAEPVRWIVEYRCFVLEDRIACFSPYARHERWMRKGDAAWIIPVEEARQLHRLVESLLSSLRGLTPPAWTLDVGCIEGKGWAVIEANPAWSAGIYQCDPTAILPVLRRACVPRRLLSAADGRWDIR